MNILRTVITATALVLSSSTNAALVERLGGLAYYDDVADLTWLADANAAGTTMNWIDANNWAADLEVAGVTGWRLADSDSCSGHNCSSEMGNLFYNVLGGSAGSSITTTHNTNYDLFSNVQSNYYWSATKYMHDADRAWVFGMSNGAQGNDYTYDFVSGYDAWAVQSGDVSAVPVPAAVWLFGSGLIGLVGFARRKQS